MEFKKGKAKYHSLLIHDYTIRDFGLSSVTGFKTLNKTNYDINYKCLICNTLEPYKITSNIYAYPLTVI